jgi:hypothetical protein
MQAAVRLTMLTSAAGLEWTPYHVLGCENIVQSGSVMSVREMRAAVACGVRLAHSALDRHLAGAMTMMLDTPIRTMVSVLVVGMWAVTGNAATFELARGADGIIVAGVKVEGDIVPGDAQELIDFYGKYGEQISPVYLRSRGGDVTEAIAMGAILRRLRLEASVPLGDTGSAPIDPIRVDHRENLICASACFLVYAGGAIRFGNYLAMHRPYLPRGQAR